MCIFLRHLRPSVVLLNADFGLPVVSCFFFASLYCLLKMEMIPNTPPTTAPTAKAERQSRRVVTSPCTLLAITIRAAVFSTFRVLAPTTPTALPLTEVCSPDRQRGENEYCKFAVFPTVRMLIL